MSEIKFSIDLSKLGLAVEQAKEAIRHFSAALSQGTLVQEMEAYLENERWRNDPLEIKKRFIDPISVSIADELRAIANWLDPKPVRPDYVALMQAHEKAMLRCSMIPSKVLEKRGKPCGDTCLQLNRDRP